MERCRSARLGSSLVLAAVVAAAWGGGTARGADWLGGAGNWADGTMWSTGIAPTSGTASIDNGNAASSVVTVNSSVGGLGLGVVIDAGDTLQLQGGQVGAAAFTVNGSLTTSGTSATLGTGQGAVTLSGTGTLTFGATTTTFSIAPGTLTGAMLTIGSGLTLSGPFTASPNPSRPQYVSNAGHITVDGAGKTVTIGASGPTGGTTPNPNTGTIEATNGANLTLAQVQNAAGATISISGGGTLESWYYSGTLNSGTISVDHSTLSLRNVGIMQGTVNLNGATVKAPDFAYSIKAGAIVSGTATFETPQSTSPMSSLAGTIRPGGAGVTGTMTFLGTNVALGQGLAFASGGHYECDLGAGGAADLLAVEGKLNLSAANDSLDLSQLPGATPGVPYLVATYGALTGTFDNVTPGYTVDYSVPGSIYVTALPEPTAAVGLGAVLLGGMMRRRARR